MPESHPGSLTSTVISEQTDTSELSSLQNTQDESAVTNSCSRRQNFQHHREQSTQLVNEADSICLKAEFDELIERHRGQLILYLVSLVHHIPDAEDLCQQCSLIMWQKFREFDRGRSFLAWACGIARLEVMNHRRSRSADRLLFHSDVMALLAESLEQLPHYPPGNQVSALRKCMQSLPEQEQAFLRRIYWEGSSFEAIAIELGCTSRTFYNRMYLLRKKLWRCVSRRLKTDQ